MKDIRFGNGVKRNSVAGFVIPAVAKEPSVYRPASFVKLISVRTVIGTVKNEIRLGVGSGNPFEFDTYQIKSYTGKRQENTCVTIVTVKEVSSFGGRDLCFVVVRGSVAVVIPATDVLSLKSRIFDGANIFPS